jgi:hypothetical protein
MSGRKPPVLLVGGKEYPVRGPRSGDRVLTIPSDDEPEPDETDHAEQFPDRLISDPERPNAASTRRILRPQIIPSNRKDATALVTATLMHQRRGLNAAKGEEEWEDADHFNQAELHAGQQVKFDLSAGQTKRLLLALIESYKSAGTYEQIMAEIGSTVLDGTDVTVLRGREREILEKLVEAEGEGFWEHVEALQPDLFQVVLLRKQHQAREAAVEEFERQMAANEWNEGAWERFFIDNTWIFGYGLAYQFLSTVQNQPNFGGARLAGRGTERGDFLMATHADVRFTVLVDIKRPDTALLAPRPYREGSGVYRVSNEVAGGVAQLQSNCATWLAEGARHPENVVLMHELGLHTHEPKGILVVGRMAQIAEDNDRVGSFERFRRRVENPEIITFDELYERARYLTRVEFDVAKSSGVDA